MKKICILTIISFIFFISLSVLAIEDNTDRPGSDYKNFDLPEPIPELCVARCLEDSRCKAYTYVEPGVQGQKARCWLKHKVPPPKESSCCKSGVRGDIPMEKNTNRGGSDYRNFDLSEPRPELCLAECLKDPRCKAYTYVKPGVHGEKARCWLKHTVPPPKESSYCVSGVK